MNRLEHTKSIIQALDEIMKDDQTLLPLQRDVLEQFKADPEKHQTGIFDLATGFGKTCIMSILMTAYLRNHPKGKVIIAVPTQTLIENEDDGGHLEHLTEFFKSFNQRFSSDLLDVGTFYSKRKEPEKQVIVTTYSSLNNLRKQINPQEVGLVLLDEAHHTITDKRIAAVKSFTNAAQYGMTATPFYSPEKSLSMVLGNTIAQVDVKKAIQKGLLSNVKNILMVSDISIDLAKELGHKQDYSEEDYKKAIEAALKASSNTNPSSPKNWEEFRKEMAINVAKLYRDYVDENLGALNGKQCMINCRTQEEARIQAEAINTLFGKEVAGWWTTDSDDKTVLDRFSQKRLNVICQVGKLTEGFDDPDISVCINYPTASQVLEAQRSGRPLHKVQNTSKEALVIDLCFRHPDYDNEVDAIRQNKQQLFMDILGAPVVRCEEIATEKKPDSENRPVLHEHTTTLPQLHGFHIISNTAELTSLYENAKKLEGDRTIPPIRPGMLVFSDLMQKYNIKSRSSISYLVNSYNNKVEFFLDSDTKHEHPIRLVEYVMGENGHAVYALHEAPEALKKLEELYPRILKPRKTRELPQETPQKIREGMRTDYDFQFSPGIVNPCLKEAYDKKIEFFLDSDTKHEHPIRLVEWVKARSISCYALHEAPEALRKFKGLYPHLFIKENYPEIKEGMLKISDIVESKKYTKIGAVLVRKFFQQVKEERFFNEKTQKLESYLTQVLYRGKVIDVLRPEAIPAFEEKFKKYLFTPLIEKGMLTAHQLAEKYGIGMQTAVDAIKKMSKETFFNEKTQKNEPFIEIRKTENGQITSVLRPEAIPFFEELYLPQILMQKRTLKQDNLSKIELVKRYRVRYDVVTRLFNKLNKETFFNEETKKEESWLTDSSIHLGKSVKVLRKEALPYFEIQFGEFFKKEREKQNELTTIPYMQEGMLSGKGIEKCYIGIYDGKNILEQLENQLFYNKNTQKQENYTIYARYSAGKPFLALRPEAIQAFETWYETKYGKKLEKRSTSTTLRPRLKAGSAKGQLKAPSPRKPSTPEI